MKAFVLPVESLLYTWIVEPDDRNDQGGISWVESDTEEGLLESARQRYHNLFKITGVKFGHISDPEIERLILIEVESPSPNSDGSKSYHTQEIITDSGIRFKRTQNTYPQDGPIPH